MFRIFHNGAAVPAAANGGQFIRTHGVATDQAQTGGPRLPANWIPVRQRSFDRIVLITVEGSAELDLPHLCVLKEVLKRHSAAFNQGGVGLAHFLGHHRGRDLVVVDRHQQPGMTGQELGDHRQRQIGVHGVAGDQRHP